APSDLAGHGRAASVVGAVVGREGVADGEEVLVHVGHLAGASTLRDVHQMRYLSGLALPDAVRSRLEVAVLGVDEHAEGLVGPRLDIVGLVDHDAKLGDLSCSCHWSLLVQVKEGPAGCLSAVGWTLLMARDY